MLVTATTVHGRRRHLARLAARCEYTVTYFAMITPTRHGWRATFAQRLPGPTDWATMELTGFRATRWRRSRAGIERAADRVLCCLNCETRHKAASYEYVGPVEKRGGYPATGTPVAQLPTVPRGPAPGARVARPDGD